MHEPAALLSRLETIGRSLAKDPRALALLGLGSVGPELERLDAWSDLDFFVIVRDGAKQAFVADLAWLAAAAPLAWTFRNTADGYKVLFADRIYAEFAVFELPELEKIPYAEGRVVWKVADLDDGFRCPKTPVPPAWQPESLEWLVGEIVSCLYVGLCRWQRGERLSAFRFVQGHAFSLLLEALAMSGTADTAIPADPFSKERRFEARYPEHAAALGPLLQGYDRTPQAARALLAFTAARFAVAAPIHDAVLALCDGPA